MVDMNTAKIDESFNKYFPKLACEFKLKDFQKKVIINTIYYGNTLCIMPTGGGKSLIYWLSGLMLGGITIVISPLIALIDEQAEKLREQGIDVLTFHSNMESKKQTELLIDFANKKLNPKFIFVSPEKIAIDGLFEFCITKRHKDISLFAVDEVHCVSQWGISFRPFYKRIPDFIQKVYSKDKYPKVLVLTATLNPKEVFDICNEFLISKSNIIKNGLLMRTEISLKVLKFNKEDEKETKLWDLLKIHGKDKILVYVYRISSEHGVKKLSPKAIDRGYKAACFHGQMSAQERKDIIHKFKNNETTVIFATSAFGMGIDIKDIRTVIHFMIPESVEQYYQEVGRAARDGNTANAYLLYTNKNIDVKRKHFIDASFPQEKKLIEVYKKITSNKIGLRTLPYFEDEDVQLCFPYFIDTGLIQVKCKGFSGFKSIDKTTNNELNTIINSTKTKNLISSVKNHLRRLVPL
jgi:ATP-dependent DNA helicase RecQ